MSGDDVRTFISVGGFLLAVSAIAGGWVYWRAVVSTRLESINKSLEDLAESHDKLSASQLEFEREVRSTYVTSSSIADFRAAMDRGFAALTERIDRLMSHQ